MLLRATTRVRNPVVLQLAGMGSTLTLVLFLIAGALLGFSPLDGAGNTTGQLLWIVAGAATVWLTGSWPGSLSWLIERSSAKQERELRPRAEAGDLLAAHLLGVSLKIRGDLAGARRFLLVAAEAGSTDAQWDLARLVDAVDGPEAARPWFQAAADGGHLGAKHIIGSQEP